MAIRVVKQGTLPETVPYEGTCSFCKTVIQCVQGDTFGKQSNDQRDASLRYVRCPTCEKDMLVSPMKNKSLKYQPSLGNPRSDYMQD